MKKKIGATAAICLVLLAAITGFYTYSIFSQAEEAIKRIGTPVVVPVTESAKVKPLTLLLMGIDYRPETGSMNSDVIMIVTVNPENQSATVVSLPRDLQLSPVGLPERKANYYYPYFTLDNKDTAFANTKDVFSTFMDVRIDYMVTVDFDGFREIVNLMGGLTINVDMDMRYVDREDGTDINLKKGVSRLDGKQVLDFVRYRKSNMDTEESSDSARNQRQQQVLNELMGSLKSAGGIAKLGQIIETVGGHISTDVPSSQIRDLLRTYFDIQTANINYIHLNGEWVSPYIVVKEEDIGAARVALKRGLGESPKDSTSESWMANPLETGSAVSEATSSNPGGSDTLR